MQFVSVRARARLVGLALVVAAGCGGGDDDDDSGPETTLFSADYADTYEEVRNCRKSSDHDLNHVRVLADPAALAPYADREEPFPEGSVVLKEEYDFADDTCEGEIIQWTVMRKQADGSDPEQLDWLWQTVAADRGVVDENASGCASCHTDCGEPPIGYAGTCAQAP